MQLNIKIVASDEEPSYVVSEVLASLYGCAIDLETHSRDSYPKEAFVLRVDSDGDLVICEMDDLGRPIEGSTWAVPQQDIKEIRLPLGAAA